ncbi:hypothetical protein [Catenuloplanes japonicus]|uniref:hypothetical protein n=1 Tax=Catenuloplanes japonicus TaxID=33876 RepID=UPI000524E819|nr:hypothetical protein [Catenuloplanes japonicus]
MLLEKTLKKGARAPQLNAKHQMLRDLLCPVAENEQRTDLERARDAEALLRAVIVEVGEKRAQFLMTLLHLTPGPEKLTLRYESAGQLMQVTGRTARTSTYKGAFLEDLALRLHSRLSAREAA